MTVKTGLSKKIKYILAVCGAAAACVLGALLIFNVDSAFNRDFCVSNLKLVQDDAAVEARWEGPSEEDFPGRRYEVIVKTELDSQVVGDAEEEHIRITDLALGQDTVVMVFAKDADGNYSRGILKHIETKKLKQEVRFDKENFVGFAGKTIELEAKGHGVIKGSSSRKGIKLKKKKERDDYSVFTVKLNKKGTYKIRFSAEGNEVYKPGKGTVQVTVYPDSLDAPQLTAEYISDSRVKLSWNNVDFAMGYELFKYNPAKEHYVKIGEFGAGELRTEITRDAGKYAVCAVTTIGDTTVDSDVSEPVEVESTAVTAKTYRSSTNIVNLNSSNLETVATIKGPGANHVPQSMSLVDDKYVITFVNSGGTSASLVAYDREGRLVSSRGVGNIGHANGTTYNPNTGNYYSVRTHKGYRSPLCTVIDGESYKITKKFNLSRQASGIAYDESNNKYYVSKGNQVYVMDENFNMERTIGKKRYNHAQDIGAYNGVALVCTWVSGKTSYIDMYRTSDGAYLGGYNVSIGEIESCVVDDGYLVIDMNTIGSRVEHIYRTKERIAIP